ncbi:hypothetical protein [Indiicoccus explosivorum]|uniref:hypothetical protein n=1 Tax=Indiicoccus explosivorum TaxID=1917864 RepID=UPI000B42F8A6|nr:hypothetical protein [Indiicoccus explosivorum]
MNQAVHIVRKSDIEKEYIQTLKLELDYELSTLFDAMQENDDKQRKKSTERLTEIHFELTALHAL